MMSLYRDMAYDKISNKINKFPQHNTCIVCILLTVIAMCKWITMNHHVHVQFVQCLLVACHSFTVCDINYIAVTEKTCHGLGLGFLALTLEYRWTKILLNSGFCSIQFTVTFAGHGMLIIKSGIESTFFMFNIWTILSSCCYNVNIAFLITCS